MRTTTTIHAIAAIAACLALSTASGPAGAATLPGLSAVNEPADAACFNNWLGYANNGCGRTVGTVRLPATPPLPFGGWVNMTVRGTAPSGTYITCRGFTVDPGGYWVAGAYSAPLGGVTLSVSVPGVYANPDTAVHAQCTMPLNANIFSYSW